MIVDILLCCCASQLAIVIQIFITSVKWGDITIAPSSDHATELYLDDFGFIRFFYLYKYWSGFCKTIKLRLFAAKFNIRFFFPFFPEISHAVAPSWSAETSLSKRRNSTDLTNKLIEVISRPQTGILHINDLSDFADARK